MVSKNKLIEQCQLSSLYHEHRECFLGNCHRIIFFIIIVSSSGSLLASGLFRGSTIIAILTLCPALLAGLDLVVNFSSASQTHRFLRYRYSSLESQLAGKEINPTTLEGIEKDIIRLMAEEPPTYLALLYHCTNLIDFREKKTQTPTLKIFWLKVLLKNIFRFSGTPPRRVCGQ